MGTPSMGWQATFALDASTFDTSSEAYDIQGESLAYENQLITPNGMMGSPSMFGGNVVEGLRGPVTGGFTLYPTATMLDRLLPRIQGAVESSDVFNPADTLPEFNAMVDRVAKVFTYTGLKVDEAVFASEPGGLLSLAIQVLGKSGSFDNAGTFPTPLTLPDEDPYRHFDTNGQVTILGASREIKRSVITIRRNLIAVVNNAQEASYIREGKRTVEWVVDLPFTSSEVDLLAGDVTGTTGSIKYVQGNRSLLATFGKLHVPKQQPRGVQQGQEIIYPVRMMALWDGTTRELVFTNDSTG